MFKDPSFRNRTWLQLWIQKKHLKPSKGCLVNHGVKPHPFPSEKAPTTHPTNPPHHHLRHVAHLPQHPARGEAMIHGCRAIILPSRAVEGCLGEASRKWRSRRKSGEIKTKDFLYVHMYIYIYLHRYRMTISFHQPGKCWHKENLLRSYSIYRNYPKNMPLLWLDQTYESHMSHSAEHKHRAWCGGHLRLR